MKYYEVVLPMNATKMAHKMIRCVSLKKNAGAPGGLQELEAWQVVFCATGWAAEQLVGPTMWGFTTRATGRCASRPGCIHHGYGASAWFSTSKRVAITMAALSQNLRHSSAMKNDAKGQRV